MRRELLRGEVRIGPLCTPQVPRAERPISPRAIRRKAGPFGSPSSTIRSRKPPQASAA